MDEKIAAQDLIVFDGLCAACSRFVRFVVHHDKAARFSFVTAQSPTGRALYAAHNLDPDEMETNIIIVGGTAHTKMQGLAIAMGTLGKPWSLLAGLRALPKPLGDGLYDLIAASRYFFGRRVCPLPSEDLRNRLIE